MISLITRSTTDPRWIAGRWKYNCV